jgi:hypothetical protein
MGEDRMGRRAGAIRLYTRVVAALSFAAASATADVYVNQSDTRALADIGSVPDPPYLLQSTYSGQQFWSVPSDSDPVSLANSATVMANASATFLHPYDDVPISPPFDAQTEGAVSYLATHGALHASATASASVFPSSYVASSSQPEDPPIQIDNPYLPGTFAGAQIAYDDEVTVSSATLAPGATVEIEVVARREAAISSTAGLGGGPPHPNHAFAESKLDLTVYDAAYEVVRYDVADTWRDESIAGALTRDDPDLVTYPFTVKIGDHVSVYQTLQIWARATAFESYATASSAADSSHTAALSFVAVTPGVTFVASSGHDYRPVPEPDALASGAVAALAAVANRARSAGRGTRSARRSGAPTHRA